MEELFFSISENDSEKLKKELFVPKFIPLLLDYSRRWEVYMGSAGSAKSYFITQKLIIRCCNEKINIKNFKICTLIRRIEYESKRWINNSSKT